MLHTAVGFKCESCTDRPVATGGPARRGIPPWLWWLLGALLLVAVPAAVLLNAVGDDDLAAATDAGGHGEPVGRESVRFEGAGGFLLGGVVDLPVDSAEPHPGVVIVGGFGPTDRDGVTGAGGVVDPLYRDLADELSAAGFAVLRYDKRGSGQSAPAPEPLTWEQRVEDTVRAVAYLRGRPDVDPQRTALIGHDEGGLIGLGIADAAVHLDGLVLLSTPGRPVLEVFAQDFRDTGDDAHDAAAEELERLAAALLATGELPEIDPELAHDGALRAMLPAGQERYLRGLLSFDPVAAAARVVSPTLIVHGGAHPDISLDTDVEPLRAALTAAPLVEVLTAPDADHTLALPSPGTGAAEQGGEHGHPGGATLVHRDERALAGIVAWLRARLGIDP